MMGQNVALAARLLAENKLVAIPTETVYGLAANALSEEAVVKIFEAKNRPAFDPLIVHVASVSDFEKYCTRIPENAMKLAEKVCPGPVTFILPKKNNIPDLVTAGHPTVGLRVPNHPLTLTLLGQIDFPLAAPSANPFGAVSPTMAEHVAQQLGNKVDYILDGGPCAVGVESTIIDFSTEKTTVLRLGGMPLEVLEEILGEKVETRTSSSNPKAPGMLMAHYSPGIPVFVGDIDELINQHVGKRVGLLRFSDWHEEIPFEKQSILSINKDLHEAARNFFSALRQFKQMDVDVVLAEWMPEVGLGRAINDRLRRAAASYN